MGKIINKYSVYLFALLFAVSGYFIGSSRQKVIIALANGGGKVAADNAGVSAGGLNILPQTAKKNAVPAPSAPPKKAAASKSPKPAPKPAPAPVVSAPAPVPAPADVPQPTTAVS